MTQSPSLESVDELGRDLSRILGTSTLEIDHPIGPLTTYRVGGRARLFVVVETSADLAALAATVAGHQVPVATLGRGSNLLIADDGFAGLVLQLGSAFEAIEEVGAFRARVGGGTALPKVARQLTGIGWTGFEWAVGVPGSIGGAVRMNAGGHGSDMAASVLAVRVVSLDSGLASTVDTGDLAFAYRSSVVSASDVVEWAELQLEAGDTATGEALIAEIVRWRRQHQPGGQNAGSVFTNPQSDSAGRLIEEAGLKGQRVGTAEVSVKHANFIQADPGGRAADVLELMRVIINRVQAQTGVSLAPETKLLGFAEELEW